MRTPDPASPSASPESSPGIRIYSRRKGALATEKVYGEGAIRFAYRNPFGRFLTDRLLSGSWFSKLYGSRQDTAKSARAIPGFVSQYEIPMGDFEAGPFESFNAFFIRRFLPGKRPFARETDVLPAFAEGRYFVFDSIGEETRLPIKGASIRLAELLGFRDSLLRTFLGGELAIARLCPVDYHRFHFPDDGRVETAYRVAGRLHSVNPAALAARGDILFRNEREVTILETEHFGKVAYIEVGALGVGKIVQSHPACTPPHAQSFRRGDEKGYFLFGGSTVIAVFEPGKIRWDADLRENSARGIETLVELGQPVARRPG